MTPAERMARVFIGNPTAHYVADFSAAKIVDGKLLPQYTAAPGAATLQDFEAHLRGERGLLVVPTDAEGMSHFGKIDVDDYKIDGAHLAQKVARLRLPLIVERSKSGGVHLAHYSRQPVPTATLREQLVEWAAQLGFAQAEIFPKQNSLPSGTKGSGINVPYFGGDSAENYALTADGQRMTLEQWLERIETPIAALNGHAVPDAAAEIVEAAALLARHWSDGQRQTLSIAIPGCLLRQGWSVDRCDALMERVIHETGARPKHYRSPDDVERTLQRGGAVFGFPKLKEIMGTEDAEAFARACGIEVAQPEPLAVPFAPLGVDGLRTAQPPVRFLVDALLPAGKVSGLLAESGTGKTSLALRLAASVVAGVEFFGRATQPGRVLFVALEDDLSTVVRRVQHVWRGMRRRMEHAKESPSAINAAESALATQLFIGAAAGRQMHFVDEAFGGVTQTATVRQFIAALPPQLSLIILDPIIRATGADENNNTAAAALVSAMERIASEASAAVLFVHHVGKAAAGARQTDHFAGRGATALVDGARNVWRLIVATDEDLKGVANVDAQAVARGEVLRLVHAKINDGPRQPETLLRRQETDFELFQAVTDPQALIGRDLDALYGWWANNGRVPFSQNDAENDSSHGLKRGRLRAAIAHGRRKGLLVDGTPLAHSPKPSLAFKEPYDGNPI